MIIKLIGMAIILSSSVLLGFGFAQCMASREDELLSLADSIELMTGELSYGHFSVKDIFFKVCPMLRGHTGEMFEIICTAIEKGDSAPLAWSDAIDEKAHSMCLKKEDADTLKNSAYLLEAYELEEQKSNLSALKDRIMTLAKEATEAKKKNSRIVKMLGIYGGILICIIVF